MKRYDMTIDGYTSSEVGMEESEYGDFVSYDEAILIINEQAARIAELEAIADQVAVPDEATRGDADVIDIGFINGWNACRSEVPRLNSGTKPFVVENWPTPQRWDYPSDGEFWGAKSMLAECKAVVESAGGEIAE